MRADSTSAARISVNDPLQCVNRQATTGHPTVSADHHGSVNEALLQVQVAEDDRSALEVEEEMPHFEHAKDDFVQPPSEIHRCCDTKELVHQGARCIPAPVDSPDKEEMELVAEETMPSLSAPPQQYDDSVACEPTVYVAPQDASILGVDNGLAPLITSLQQDIRHLAEVLSDGIAIHVRNAQCVLNYAPHATGVPLIVPNEQTTGADALATICSTLKDADDTNAPVTISSTFKDAAVGTPPAAPRDIVSSHGDETAPSIRTTTASQLLARDHQTGTVVADTDVLVPQSPMVQTAVTNTAFLGSSTLTLPPSSQVCFAECYGQGVRDHDVDVQIVSERSILNMCGKCKKQTQEPHTACQECQTVRCSECYEKHFCEYCGCVDDHVVCPACLQRTIMHKVCRRTLKVCVDCCLDVCSTTCYKSHRCISGINRQA